MTYDDWKTKDDQPEDEPKQETELELVYADLARLQRSHAALLAAAKDTLDAWSNKSGMGTVYEMDRASATLRAAIRAAEERRP